MASSALLLIHIRLCVLIFLTLIWVAVFPAPALGGAAFPWNPSTSTQTVASRFPPPAGFTRLSVASDGFGAWLRQLPVFPGRPNVKLFDGSLKSNQAAQAAVLDIDVGARDLQQCADAVMRLRAEYLRSVDKPEQICFRLTDETNAVWSDWAEGYRGQTVGKRIVFQRTSASDASYPAFRKYLNLVFAYAGSMSLHKELQPVPASQNVEPGDVFIKGGFPGHAVIVLDVAEAPDGSRMFLLAQSYMPAQQIHVLVNPEGSSAWYKDPRPAPLVTPEWTFPAGSLHRFSNRKCARARSR